MLKQLAVDGAVDRVEGGWLATGVAWVYDQAHYDGIVATRRRRRTSCARTRAASVA